MLLQRRKVRIKFNRNFLFFFSSCFVKTNLLFSNFLSYRYVVSLTRKMRNTFDGLYGLRNRFDACYGVNHMSISLASPFMQWSVADGTIYFGICVGEIPKSAKESECIPHFAYESALTIYDMVVCVLLFPFYLSNTNLVSLFLILWNIRYTGLKHTSPISEFTGPISDF